jgi:hypothetical protein
MQFLRAITVQKFGALFCHFTRRERFVPEANDAKISCIAKGKLWSVILRTYSGQFAGARAEAN